MRGLLDNELLDGPHEVSSRLRPVRSAWPVEIGDVIGALDRIERLCQLWGGAGQPLLPVRDGHIPEFYGRLLETELIDYVAPGVEVATPRRVEQAASSATPVVVIASGERRDQWVRPVQVVELEADDSWRPIYASVLGTLPVAPDPEQLEAGFLRTNLVFEEFFPTERVKAVGSLPDLLARLADPDSGTPRELSNLHLAAGMQPDFGYLGQPQTLPSRYPLRRPAGPNIIVAVGQGSVDDLALLWNLRAAHGDHRVLPIGLPVSEVNAESLDEIGKPGRAVRFGFAGGTCYLTSASVSTSQLQELAAGAGRVVVAGPHELLTFGPAPGRPGSHVGFWTSGRARLTVIGAANRDVLRPLQTAKGADLVVDVRVRNRRLPADPTMRGDPLYSYSFRGGAAQVSVPQALRDDTAEVAWPSSWTSLAAVAQSRGLVAKPSDAGLAAVALLESLGGIDQVRPLLHRPLIDLLYKLGERSGMSWFKRRWTDAHKKLLAHGADKAVLEQTAHELGRDEPVIAPSGEGRDLPFEQFRKAFDGNREVAAQWVEWAERRHLLVRGARIECPACRARSWLPMASLPPPIGCTGCGREIDQPYRASGLEFSYRLGEPLRRVLETDSLGHVIALRWFTELLDRVGLVGAHPGVIFTDPLTGNDIGEADVILATHDGELVPVEVKRRVAGVDTRAIELMDTLATALNAPWDVIAVTQPARDCPGLAKHRRDKPDRLRFVITNDQLHEDFVKWTLALNPFNASPYDADVDHEREKNFVNRIREFGLEHPRDYVSETILKLDDP